jgi:hypothetical protein
VLFLSLSIFFHKDLGSGLIIIVIIFIQNRIFGFAFYSEKEFIF